MRNLQELADKGVFVMHLLALILFLVFSSNICFLIPKDTFALNVEELSKLAKIGNKTERYSTTSKILSKGYLIKNLTVEDFRLLSKSENISGLLEKAVNENLIKYSDNLYYYKKFNEFPEGDILLLKCLQHPNCKVENYLNILEKSSLHRTIASKYPELNLVQVNHKVGKVSENLMSRYFQSSGWTKIEGEIGRNGIDGLFVRRNRDGVVTDVIIVESKYNTSTLNDTIGSGKQMSKKWAMSRIEKLKEKYPDDSTYSQIERYITTDSYRARLWTLKATENELIVSLEKIESELDDVVVSNLRGGENTKINYTSNNKISIDNPLNDFQKQLLDWYQEEIKNI